MADSTDIAIVGGGIMGSATAFFLLSDPAFRGRVTVIERDPTYRFATSALSASSIRQQFSTPVNIHLSLFGIGFLREVVQHLGVDGEALSIGLREPGYLILAGPEHEALLRGNVALQCAHGADIAALGPADLAARFPWMALDGVAVAGFGVTGEGSFDGPALLQAFRRKAVSLGARYVKAEVVAAEARGSRVVALRLADGTTLACGAMVNAAGPNSGTVAGYLGIDLPVRPRKRTVFVFRSPAALPRPMPLVIDTNGVWVRPEGEAYVAGVSPPEHLDTDAIDFEMDHAQFDDPVWPTIAARIPGFETLRLSGGWAGHYEVNTLDHNAVIGPHPDISNLLFITGFSGHGMQHAAGAGRAVAEWLVHGRYLTIDVAPLGYARVRDGRPLRELNVI
jgi:FAD-dependent oxidoreductase domain-containing protein 1